MTTTTTPVTPRQLEILAWVADYIAKRGFSPTVREGVRAFDFNSPNGFVCHLHALKKKGCLSWVEGSPRTLRVTPEGEEVLHAAR